MLTLVHCRRRISGCIVMDDAGFVKSPTEVEMDEVAMDKKY